MENTRDFDADAEDEHGSKARRQHNVIPLNTCPHFHFYKKCKFSIKWTE